MQLFVLLYLGYCLELVYPFVFHSTRVRYTFPKSSLLASSSKTVDVSSLKKRLSSATENVGTASSLFNLKAIRSSIEDLETAASQDGFWDDADNAQKLMQELESQKFTLSRVRRWEEALADCKTALELCSADDEIVGNEFASEADEILTVLEYEVEALKLEQSLSGPFDKADCRVVITAGAGGTDAQDWAQRMYTRWAEQRGFEVKLVDLSDADEGCGIRSAELIISGKNAFGLLALEKGTHRLVRISPFNSLGKRQTSFAGVETLPILRDQDLEEWPDIPEKDIAMSFMRSGGAGGQNVNKVESGVLLKHLPTGLAVKCTQERSQLQNRAIALRLLKSKLLVVQREQEAATWADIRGDVVDANFGQQIRNYVLHPYKMAKDTRSGYETSNIQSLLDGNLDDFLAANLRHSLSQKQEDLQNRAV